MNVKIESADAQTLVFHDANTHFAFECTDRQLMALRQFVQGHDTYAGGFACAGLDLIIVGNTALVSCQAAGGTQIYCATLCVDTLQRALDLPTDNGSV
jgi:hypothetical protein